MKIIAMLVLGITLLFSAVDINTAGKKELMNLKGVGAKKADAILAYRKVKCFKNVKALKNVKGIGPKLIKRNRENLEASKCKK